MQMLLLCLNHTKQHATLRVIVLVLLFVPLKLLKRLAITRLKPLIGSLLPDTRAGFHLGGCATDRMTSKWFKACEKLREVLLDLASAYHTVWHRGLI